MTDRMMRHHAAPWWITALAEIADREREHEERRQRRGETDVNYGASEEQVPEIGWIT